MKVLISAYICAPHRGSEPGAGWNWSLAAAADNHVWVVTRETNRDAIEAELAENPHPRLHFSYVELPPWGLRLKKGERGIRYFSYYTLWQLAALRRARELHAEIGFDLVHHVTFANMWLPALAGFVQAPFVLGPVGGGPRVPLRLYRELGPIGAIREGARVVLQSASRANPLTRATWRTASTIIVQNRETRDALPRKHRARVIIRPHTSVQDTSPRVDRPERVITRACMRCWRAASSHGRADRCPACDRADARLVVDRDRLRPRPGATAMISQARLELGDRVSFVPWLAQADLWSAMAEADALLLPSLRDDAPFVVGEAQAIGLPVVAFDQGGAREFAAFPHSSVLTVPLTGADPAGELANGLERAAPCRADLASTRTACPG